MNDNTLNYFESTDTVFSILSEISGYHVSARKKHYELLGLLKHKGVAFGDIRKYLLNRAMEIGLWERGMREKECMKRSWYVAMTNFVAWTRKHFTAYGVIKDIKKLQATGANKIVKSTTVVRKKDASGNVISESETVVEGTLAERVAKVKAQAEAEKQALMNKPITDSLTDLQIHQIMMQNLHLLGKFAEEKSAVPEFNAFMAAIGAFDELIGYDDPEMIEGAEALAVQ